MLRPITLSLLSLAIASTCHASDAVGIFARAKAASGGAHWDAIGSWRADGTASTGGMSGAFQVTVDARTGRSADAYQIGPVEGADGFDGKQSWRRDPGGEVAALDAPEALRRAHSDAWVSAHGYWYPQRMPGNSGEVTSKMLDGKRYVVVVATPQGGDPVTLWFANDTGLLARVQEPQGSSVATTVYDDYRLVDGVRIPFRAMIDVTDAAGRTDPRDRSEVRFEHVALNVPIVDADFAMPKMVATARIDNQDGKTAIPFDLVNNHIYVDGRVDGKPARFMVDTGGTNL
ncbi:MAG TPA: peptide-binding protein, partial [Xanthomonadaceae bacterium]|nr:peptide-binding protein [Xanthomonadaceae bacterium]